jgi:hypothetical protein
MIESHSDYIIIIAYNCKLTYTNYYYYYFVSSIIIWE